MMKRRALKLFLFLLAGAIINVAVAWGLAWHGHYRIQQTMKTLRALRVSTVPAICDKSDLTLTRRPHAIRIDLGYPMATGWPCRSHEAEGGVASSGHASSWSTGIRVGAQTVGLSSTSEIVFPVRPRHPGFAINTIFYAAIVWMLFTVPGAVRRRVRRKRGQCAACGYSRRESVSEKCPECGATTIKQKAETQKA
jgi:hypothetical protein